MNAQLPSRRSAQLEPLSKEHKEGIEFVDRIRWGLSYVTLDRLRSYTCWYWKNHIRPHFFQEEKILLPYLPANHPMAKRIIEDHEYIRDLILTLDHESNRHSFKALVDMLSSHVRFEEHQLYPYLEQILSEQELNSIYSELVAHPVADGEWADTFWTNNGN
jgi:hypothetical protein